MKHTWEGHCVGGPPDDASSYEFVVVCTECGAEQNEDNKEEECLSLGEPEYQPDTVGVGVELDKGIRPLTAEFFVTWLIEYHGLPEKARQTVVRNLKRDYARVELQGALKYAAKLQAPVQITVTPAPPAPPSHFHFSLFGVKK